MDLSIIIINWNSNVLLLKCVSALMSSSFTDFEIFIVDNNSCDNSLNLLKTSINDPRIKYILNKENLGFAKACNNALQYVRSKYVLFLNPDTEVRKDTIEKSIKLMEEMNLEVLGVKNIDYYGNVHRSCARFPSTKRLMFDIIGLSKLFPKIFTPGLLMEDWDHSYSKYVDHVIGSYYLTKYSVLKKTGFFAEQFFLYLEDLDLSTRIRRNGGRIYYCAEIEIIHIGGGISGKYISDRLFNSLKSKIIFCEKYNELINKNLITAATALIEPFTRFFYAILTFRLNEIIDIFNAFYKFYLWMLRRKKKN